MNNKNEIENDLSKKKKDPKSDYKYLNANVKSEFLKRQDQERLREFKKTWKLDQKEQKNIFSFIPWILAILVVLVASKMRAFRISCQPPIVREIVS
jgi:hypothetical protein